MFVCSASLLLKCVALLGGGVNACLKTAPGTVTPPCGMCTFDSFYLTDQCPTDSPGCRVIPPEQVVTHITTAGGCREEEMRCPAESFVAASIDGKAIPTGTTWTNFVTVFSNKIVCDNNRNWLKITEDETAGNLDYIYCYYPCSLSCQNLQPSPSNLCFPPNCLMPVYTYMSTADGVCRTFTPDCASDEPAGSTGFTFNIYSDSGVAKLTTDQLQTASISCSGTDRWTITFDGTTDDINSIGCEYKIAPGTVTPPCGMCTFDSFYPTDQCPPNNPKCRVIPPKQVVTHITTAGGCREEEMSCPAGSSVALNINQTTTIGTWTEFVDNFKFDKFVCNNDETWLITIKAGNATALWSIYCYYECVSPCSDLPPPPSDQCFPPNCLMPVYTYTPTASDVCQLVIDCVTNAPKNFTGFTFNIYSDSGVAKLTVDQLQTVADISCSGTNRWTITFGGTTNNINSIGCEYT